MNEKYVITAIHKHSAWYGDRKAMVGNWVYLDPTTFSVQSELGKGWIYGESDESYPDDVVELAIYGFKGMPLDEYKKKHPDLHPRKVSKKVLDS